jgi:GNAT superfamily N-acetyltransferase
MIIKEAQQTDVAAMVRFGKSFWEQTSYHAQGVAYSSLSITAMTIKLIETGIVLVAYDGERVIGLMLMVVGPMPFNPSTLCATELVYYVDPDYREGGTGLTLIKQAEKIAASKGVKYVSMIHLDSVVPEKAESIYNTMGYARTETLFTKDIS